MEVVVMFRERGWGVMHCGLCREALWTEEEVDTSCRFDQGELKMS